MEYDAAILKYQKKEEITFSCNFYHLYPFRKISSLSETVRTLKR